MPYMDPVGDLETSGELFISYIHVAFLTAKKKNPPRNVPSQCSAPTSTIFLKFPGKKIHIMYMLVLFQNHNSLAKISPIQTISKKIRQNPPTLKKQSFFRANRASPQALCPWRCWKLNLLHGFFNQTNLIARQHFGLMQPPLEGDSRFRTPRFKPRNVWWGVGGG